MHLVYLANQVPWFGARSGYGRLPGYVRQSGIPTRCHISRTHPVTRTLGKIVSLARGHGRISQADAFARARVELALLLDRQAVGHLLHGEDHLRPWADAFPSALQRTVITLHQPPKVWDKGHLPALASYRHVIVLWQRDFNWFQERMPEGTLHFIPHGVDTEFFTPAPEPLPSHGPLRLLYAGLHLRNAAMLARIIPRLTRHRADLHFDLLVPRHGRANPAFAGLHDHPGITWHEGLNDEGLRHLYRQAHLLLLPMDDSGANTAIVEALACGLPIVTTDVGGIRDYGGEAVFPLIQNDDDDGMIALVEDYLANPARRTEMGARGRVFAETALAWPIIAQRHLAVYREIVP